MNRPEPGDESMDMTSALVDRSRRSPSKGDGIPDARPGEPDDSSLILMVRAGEATALETLYGRYGRACYSLARRILNDVTLAQDVVQEVFLAVWRDPTRYDARRGGFSTWLMSTTHHKAVDSVRREENLRKRANAAEVVRAAAPPDPSPEDEVWTNVRGEQVRAALATLPDSQREALRLAYFGGYTQREVAGLTNTPLGTVKTRMLAGMRKLREALEVALDEVGTRENGGGVSPT